MSLEHVARQWCHLVDHLHHGRAQVIDHDRVGLGDGGGNRGLMPINKQRLFGKNGVEAIRQPDRHSM